MDPIDNVLDIESFSIAHLNELIVYFENIQKLIHRTITRTMSHAIQFIEICDHCYINEVANCFDSSLAMLLRLNDKLRQLADIYAENETTVDFLIATKEQRTTTH